MSEVQRIRFGELFTITPTFPSPEAEAIVVEPDPYAGSFTRIDSQEFVIEGGGKARLRLNAEHAPWKNSASVETPAGPIKSSVTVYNGELTVNPDTLPVFPSVVVFGLGDELHNVRFSVIFGGSLYKGLRQESWVNAVEGDDGTETEAVIFYQLFSEDGVRKRVYFPQDAVVFRRVQFVLEK